MKIITLITVLLFIIILASCTPATQTTPTGTAVPTTTQTPIPVHTPTSTPVSTYTAMPTLAPNRIVKESPDLLQYCKDDGSNPMHPYIRARRVWGPILSPCEMVSGLIVKIGEWPNRGDGDYVFNLRLDPGQEKFLDIGDMQTWGGTIHCEIDPKDQDYLGLPAKGKRVVLVGAWVHDPSDEGQIGWNEIHPVMYWAYLQ